MAVANCSQHEATLISPCIHDHVRAYLTNGTLPDGKETCKGLETPEIGNNLTAFDTGVPGEGFSMLDLMSY